MDNNRVMRSIQRQSAPGSTSIQGGRPARPLLWGFVLILMVGWSLLSGLGYMLADPVLSWLGAVATGVVQNGQGVAEAYGGKAAGEAVKALDSSGVMGQILAAAQTILKPAIIVVWGLGMLLLATLPKLAGAAGRLLGRR